jgi:hypothetical protein
VTVSTGIASIGGREGPSRAPLICGALGSYERARVLEIAASLGGEVRAVHEDERAMLMLDREPLAWTGRRERGLGWVEGSLWSGGARDWREASRRGACGLVLNGRRRFLHSSVNGLGAVYWLEEDGGTYFASRIDPLVLTARRLLSIDWDAWASIIALRYPLGERTPFAEIRRLEPFSVLRRRLRRARAHSPPWPWAETDPGLDLDHGADAVLEGLRATIAPLDRPAACPLSGGRDSRMVTCALAEIGMASGALTVSDDEGDTYEEDLAAPVAAALGIGHERVGSSAADYPGEWMQRADDVEYQFVDHAWLVPLARRVAGKGLLLGDGFAIDTLLQRGSRFYRSETLDHRSPRRSSLALFDSLRQYGAAESALGEPLREPLLARAREGFLTAAKPFEGHPAQATLSFYRTRSVRGVSTYPSGLLGRAAQILAPAGSDAVAVAALSVTPEGRSGDGLYGAVFDRLNPAVGALPSTSDTPRRPPRLPRRWCSAPAVDAHREHLEAGPFAPHLSPELCAWLAAPETGELSPDLRIGIEAISLFHAWCDRYQSRLRNVDIAELRD